MSNGFVRSLSALISRAQLAARAGLRFGGKRNYYEAFGYQPVLQFADYLAKYQRQDVAKRIIDAPASGLWGKPPVISSTDETFNEAWKTVVKRTKFWTQIDKLDRLTALGEFAVLVFGFDDGALLDKPVKGNRSRNLLYLQPYSQGSVTSINWVSDPLNARFGKADLYQITMSDLTTSDTIRRPVFSATSFWVHHSRTIHSVQNALESEVVGLPALAPVFNLLDDLLKVTGSSAEVYWLNARQGMQIDIDKEMELDAEDEKALSAEIDEFIHQLRRVIRTRGTKVNPLTTEVPSPTAMFDAIIDLIGAATGIPRSVLLGSEISSSSSEQDRNNWSQLIEYRQQQYGEEQVLIPIIDKLQAFGILPQSPYTIEWPDPFAMSPLERAQVMAQQARAIANLSWQSQRGDVISRVEARKIVGLEGDIPAGEPLIRGPEQLPATSDASPSQDPDEIMEEAADVVVDEGGSTEVGGVGTVDRDIAEAVHEEISGQGNNR